VLDSSKSQSPFFSKNFLSALLELDLKQERVELYVDSLDTLLLKIEEDTIVSVGDRNYVDYRCTSDNTNDIVRILKESEYNKIFIDSVQFEEVQSLNKKIIESNFSIKLTPRDISVYIELPKTYEEYLANLGKKKRHELKRKLNKFTREFSDYKILKGHSKDQFISFIELHKNSSKEKEEFMTKDTQDFFYRLLNIDGWTIYLLLVKGEVVAGNFCYENEEASYLYNSGKNKLFDPFSVGMYLTHYLIKKSIKQKKKTFDFLKGSERYKFDLGGVVRQLYDIEIKKYEDITD
jgi:hypothetical protein